MKIVDLGGGLLGQIVHTADGHSWTIMTAKGEIFHQGDAATIDDAVAAMEARLAGNESAAEPEGMLIADESTEPTDDSDEAADEAAGKKLRGKLPDGFPGKAALDEAGYGTYARVRKLHEQGKLIEVPGIGEVTAGHIGEALSEG